MSDKKNPQYGQFCWNELMTPDTKKAKEFYASLFGWKTEDHKMPDHVYSMIKDNYGGMMQTPKGKEKEIPPHWMSYVNVQDVEASVKKAKSLGAEVKVPVSVAGEYGRFAVIKDPTGAVLGLWQSTKQ